jgi:hypothetical protein
VVVYFDKAIHSPPHGKCKLQSAHRIVWLLNDGKTDSFSSKWRFATA